MELTTDLVVRSRSNTTTTHIIASARRRPTPDDWQRWESRVSARYRSVPARVLIAEMEADGLHVTEKMFRDRLRQWGMNNKNRRGTAKTRRIVAGSANTEDSNFIQPVPSHHTAYRSSSQRVLPELWSLLHTPDETGQLQRALKGVMDWQQHFDVSPHAIHDVLSNAHCFEKELGNICGTLDLNLIHPWTCKMATQMLQGRSARLRSYLGASCTPLAIFRSIGPLLWLAIEHNRSKWLSETARFLINAAAEAFPSSHPTLLLLQLLFSDPTPARLAAVYEAGSKILQQYCGKAEAAIFRAEFLWATVVSGMGAEFSSYVDTVCAATSDVNVPRHEFVIARLYLTVARYEEAAEVLRRSLAKLEGEGNGLSWLSAGFFFMLAGLQCSQSDVAGEETSLRKVVAITQALESKSCRKSRLGFRSWKAISELASFYRRKAMKEKHDALRLEYPSVFEL